jgi:hypothetical protein
MKIETHANGSIELWLTPETAIEKVFISEMKSRAAKGQGVKLSGDEQRLVVAVEQ